MWQVENLTPFAAAGNWIRDRDGAEVWLVAVRCTFRILPDSTTEPSEEQPSPIMAPTYRGDPAASSMIYDTDFCLTKPTTDVLLNGHAYAPGGVPTRRVDVTMRLPGISKTLRIEGDREYQRDVFGVSTGSAQPFIKMPIIYERTYGGKEPDRPVNVNRPQFDVRNPIGTGFAPSLGAVAPNIRNPALSAKDPSGFGPIPPHWQARVKYAGTYDTKWEKERLPLYPDDLDDRFFLCSPADQRPKSFLRGGEIVDLVNLTPEGQLAFMLPRVAFRFETEFRGKPSVAHRANLHTVIIEPDVPQLVMVWHTALRAHADVLRLTQTVVRQLQVLDLTSGPL